MDTKNFTDRGLLERLDKLVKEERELLTSVLHCLREVERRRLFSSLGFSSLFDFAVRKLGYSEDQAQRRIQAMRLVREIPEVEEKISSGELTLSNIGLARAFLNREERSQDKEFSKAETIEVLNLVSGLPTREAEKALIAISTGGIVPKPDRERALSPELVEIRATVSTETSAKFARLRGVLAHSHPNLTLGDLIDLMCDAGLEKWAGDPPATSRVTMRQLRRQRSRLHKAVFSRDKGRCTNCQSTHALQIDHIQPKAMGGTDSIENLRLLCRSCNQRKAIEAFGQRKMDKFLTSDGAKPTYNAHSEKNSDP